MFPISLSLSLPELFGGQPISLMLDGPVTTFVGPNGSGKSQVMRKLKNELQQRIGNTLLLASGRLQPMEHGRLVVNPSSPEPRDDARLTIDESFRPNWFKLETVQVDCFI